MGYKLWVLIEHPVVDAWPRSYYLCTWLFPFISPSPTRLTSIRHWHCHAPLKRVHPDVRVVPNRGRYATSFCTGPHTMYVWGLRSCRSAALGTWSRRGRLIRGAKVCCRSEDHRWQRLSHNPEMSPVEERGHVIVVCHRVIHLVLPDRMNHILEQLVR